MMKSTRYLGKGLLGIDAIAAVALVLLMLHVSLNAFLRAFFNHPLQNTLEITQYWYLPIVALLGLATAMTKGEHLGADLLVDRLQERTQSVLEGIVGFLSAVFCAAVTYFSLLEAIENARIGTTGGATAVPIWPATFAAPLAFLILTVLYLARGVALLRNPDAPRRAPAEKDEPAMEMFE